MYAKAIDQYLDLTSTLVERIARFAKVVAPGLFVILGTASAAKATPHGFPNWRPPTGGENPYQLTENCYYCTVVALVGLTIDQLVQRTEQMQHQTETIGGALHLFMEAGIRNIAYGRFDNGRNAYNVIRRQIASGQAVGVAYTHPGASDGHMVVAVRDDGYVGTPGWEEVYVFDYQDPSNPTRRSFPPPSPMKMVPDFMSSIRMMVRSAQRRQGIAARTIWTRPNAPIAP